MNLHPIPLEGEKLPDTVPSFRELSARVEICYQTCNNGEVRPDLRHAASIWLTHWGRCIAAKHGTLKPNMIQEHWTYNYI